MFILAALCIMTLKAETQLIWKVTIQSLINKYTNFKIVSIFKNTLRYMFQIVVNSC